VGINVHLGSAQLESSDVGSRPSFDALLLQIRECGPAADVFSMQATMADRRITIDSDDPSLLPLFFMMFGGATAAATRSSAAVSTIPSDIHLDVRARFHPDFGWFGLSGRNELPFDGREFDYAISEAHGHFAALPTDDAGWKSVAFRGSDVPMFAFRDRDCLFSLGPRWRLSIVWFLFWRLLRTRPDAIFFHASALGIFGEGTIFVGPSGGGKSTISLALAARGHNFLSDEVAAYLPDRGEVMPFRRPVGIKPGPRASAVEKGLPAAAAAQIEREGFFRVPIDTIFRTEPARTFPLGRVVFLRGFAERPRLQRINPGRAEIVELQPLMSSFLNAPHSRRIFELTRLLATTKVYQLHPGDPDETAFYLEEAFACE